MVKINTSPIVIRNLIHEGFKIVIIFEEVSKSEKFWERDKFIEVRLIKNIIIKAIERKKLGDGVFRV
jgi:hypothetical protein